MSGRDPKQIEQGHVKNHAVKSEWSVRSEREQQADQRGGGPKICTGIRLQGDSCYRQHQRQHANVTDHLRIEGWADIWGAKQTAIATSDDVRRDECQDESSRH